jgi:DASS family divalent anion:Na+ symporter
VLPPGVPGLLAVLSLAYNGNLFGGITQFASGQAAIYYGSGYNTLPEWFWLGGVFGYLSLIVYIVGGWPWWKFLGWF